MKELFIFLMIILNVNFAFGYVIEDVSNGCHERYNNAYPVFFINKYACDSGYYLPADAVACEECRPGYNCSGGTYMYNENINQGINLIITDLVPTDGIAGCDNWYGNMYPVFVANQYVCQIGSYLPANATECSICPVDSYCGGGTYSFNETVPQGIVSCASGLFAPSGMWESAQCGRILHIGDNVVYLHSVKKTTPALHVDIDQDGIADYFGNMTTLDVPMTRGTERKLKLQYDGVTYSVYDDSVDLGQYTN
jgi:hypothetical protein